MMLDKEELQAFQVTGITVRTINSDGQSGKDIKGLWDQFFSEDVRNAIPNKLSDDIYCVYTEYESDYTGHYTALLGCKTLPVETSKKGLNSILIPEARYQVYESAGKQPAGVLNTWAEIWQSDTNRAYAADFDVYGPESWDEDNGKVMTYLGIK